MAGGRRLHPRVGCSNGIGGLAIDIRNHEVTVDRRPVELVRKEFELLIGSARHAGEIVSKRDLLAGVWQLTWAVRAALCRFTCPRRAASLAKRPRSRAFCRAFVASASGWRPP